MTTFTNSTGVTFLGPVFTTSQTVTVTGLTGPLATVSVTLTGLSHNVADDLDFLLVAPDGTTNLLFWSDVGGAQAGFTNRNFVIADAGTTALTNTSSPALVSGTYKPADYTDTFSGEGIETGASFGTSLTLNHATDTGTATFASVFTGYANPNGVWRLYLKDDANGDGGSLVSWSLNITAGSVSLIGDKVFEDLNGNGIQDSGEPGVNGVTVQLLNSSNAVVDTQTTANGGLYNFTNVADGTYSVKFITAGGTNYTFTSQDQGGNDALDSDVNASGQTAQFAVAGSNITNIDAGLKGTHIGNKVFGDLDHDGIQGAGETGVDGVTVRLLNSSNATVATTVTANGGTYDFANVTPGTYSVEIVAPTGFSFGPKDQGSDDALDSDVNASNPNIGRSDQFSIVLGQTISNVDAGVYATSGFGTFTFTNAAGVNFSVAAANQTVQTLTIGGVAGPIAQIKVHINGLTHNLPDDLDFWLVGPDGTSNLLFLSDTGGVAASGPVNLVIADSAAAALPDAGGLSSGTFKPTDYTTVAEGAETASTFGASGLTLNHASTAGTTTFATAFTGLSPNGTWTLYARDDSGGDAGNFSSWGLEITTASVSVIGDKVFEDLNGNGVQDSGEPGVDGVTVQLLNSSNVVVDTETTANGGLYHFTNVADGTYSVKFVIPGGFNYAFTTQDQGGNDALDSDANASGQTVQFAVAGSNITNIDAGLKGTHIGNKVFGDLDHDGVQDAGDTGLDGVVVHLLNSSNATVATTKTANGGVYDFANVAPGNYSVKVDLPSQFSFSSKDAVSGTDATDSDVDTATGQTAQFAVVLGQTVSNVDAGVYATNGVGTFTFTNSIGAVFPAATALTLVQTFSVGGVAGGISNIKVLINGLTHNLGDDLDFLLVGPDGTSNLLFWSDAGGTVPVSGAPATFVIADSGAALLPDSTSPSSGTFRPTDYTTALEGLETAASFGASGFTINHATTAGTATFASIFTDLSPNGTWTLYLRDDASGDAGTISSWGLEITTVLLNEPPTITNLDGDSTAFTEGGTPLLLDQTAAAIVADPDSTDFNGGSLTVAVDSALPEDALSIVANANILLSGSVVQYDADGAGAGVPVNIGTVSGGTGGTPLVVNFNTANATQAAISALVHQIAYQNTNTTEPNTAVRTVRFTVDDGDGATSVDSAVTVSVGAVNDPPTLTTNGVNPTYAENAAGVDLFTTPVTVSAVESTDRINQIVLTVSGIADGFNEILRIDGSDVTLTDLTSVTTATNGLTVAVSISSGVATVTLSTAPAGILSSTMATVVDGITYADLGDNPTAGNRIVTLTSIRDTGGTSPGVDATTLSIASTVGVSPVNDAPTVDLNGAAGGTGVTLTYQENDLAKVIGPSATVGDVDSADFDGGSLTVAFTANGSSEDQLTIRNQGASAGEIGVSGTDVTYGGGVIGTWSGGTDGTGLSVSLNGDATQAAVTALAGNIQYFNNSDNPSTAARTVRFTVTDGDGGADNGFADATINVTAVNDAPTIVTPISLSGTRDAPVTITGVTFADIDSGNGDVVATFSAATGFFAAVDGGGVTVIGTGTDTLRLTGTTTDLTDFISGNNLTFTAPANETVHVILDDQGNAPAPAKNSGSFDIAIELDAVPVITNVGGDSVTFTEDGPAVLLDVGGDALVTDDDQSNLNGGNLTISVSGGVATEDVLGISATGDVTLSDRTNSGSIVSVGGTAIGTVTSEGTGGSDLVIAFNSTDATPAKISTLIHALTYANTNTADPSVFQRAITVSVDDGVGGVGTETVFVDITAVNDAPVNTVPVGPLTVAEDTDLVINGLAVNDVDLGFNVMTVTLHVEHGTITVDDTVPGGLDSSEISGNGTATVTLTCNPANISTTLATGVIYRGDADYNGADTLTMVSNDAGNTGVDPGLSGTATSEEDIDTVSINVTSVEDLPVFSGLDNTPLYAENGPRVLLDSDATIVDNDGPITGATLTLARAGGGNPDDVFDANGSPLLLDEGQVLLLQDVDPDPIDVNFQYVAVGSYSKVDGTLVITFNEQATSASVNAVLQNINYANGSDTPPASVTIGYVFDNGAQATGQIVVQIDAVNDIPDVEGVSPTALFHPGGSAITLSSGITISDPDGTTLTGATVQITNFQVGDALDADTGATGITAVFLSDTLVLTGTASLDDYRQVLASVSYTTGASDPAAADPTRVIAWQVDDGSPGGSGLSDTESTTVYFAPTVDLDLSAAGIDFSTAFSENGAAVAIVDTDVAVMAGTYSLSSARIVLTNAQADDQLAVGALPAGISSAIDTSTPGQIAIDLTGVASAANYQLALRQISFANTSDDPDTTVRAVTVTVSDGNETSDVAQTTITVTAVNDVPPVASSGGVTAALEQIATAVDPGFVVSDPDSLTLASGRVSITGNFQAGEDVLGFVNDGVSMGNIVAVYNALTGVLDLTSAGASATLLQWQAALRAVTYTDTADAPDIALRTVTFTVNDGGGDSAPASQQVSVTALDDPAVLHNDAVATLENAVLAGSVFANNGAGADADPDSTLTVTAVNGVGASVGSQIALASGALLTLNANGTFSYNPNHAFDSLPAPASGASNTTATDGFSYTVGGSTAQVTVTVTGVDSNDVLIGTGGNDTLIGGIGSDIVSSLGGADRIVFNTPAQGVDSILDFNALAGDLLVLNGAGFGLAGTGSLAAAGVDFVLGGTPLSGAPTLLYNGITGTPSADVYFDPDGTGAQAAVLLAHIGGLVVPDTQVALSNTLGHTLITGDFNGDGTPDNLWHRTSDGANFIWLMANGGISTQVGLPATPGYQFAAVSDFDASGTSDLLLWRPSDGNVQLWLFGADGAITGNPALPAMPGYELLTSADFNGDGSNDVLWANASTGATVAWFIAGGTLASQQPLYSSQGWEFVSTLDANGDGSADILWRNQADASTNLWLMPVGGNVADHPSLYSVNGWSYVTSADFNGDGHQDLLWQRDSDGATNAWLLGADGTVTSNPTLHSIQGWSFVVSEDFNSDGTSDLLWRRDADGLTDLWLMANNGTIAANPVLPSAFGYSFLAAADINGDGARDLLWHDPANDRVVAWVASDLAQGQLAVSVVADAPHGATALAVDDTGAPGELQITWQNTSSGATSTLQLNNVIAHLADDWIVV